MKSANCIDTNSVAALAASDLPNWRDYAAIGARKIAHDFMAAIELLGAWDQRRRERRFLLGLDDGILKDIGISGADAWAEGRKPFWRR